MTKAQQKEAPLPIPIQQLVENVTPSRSRTYTLDNPPPHLKSLSREHLQRAYQWARGDWYLIEILPDGYKVHNNRAVADAWRAKNKKTGKKQ